MVSDKARQKYLDKLNKKSKHSATHGELVFQQLFGTQTIRAYAGGYISVGGVFKEPEPEKLLGINFDVSTGKKTGLGRAVGAVVTSGLSLLSGNVRGDVYIAIQTDKSNHMVHSQFPTTEEVAELRRLELITQQFLSQNQQAIGASEVPTQESSVAAQIQSLASLVEQGLLTDEEFASAKAKLLGI